MKKFIAVVLIGTLVLVAAPVVAQNFVWNEQGADEENSGNVSLSIAGQTVTGTSQSTWNTTAANNQMLVSGSTDLVSNVLGGSSNYIYYIRKNGQYALLHEGGNIEVGDVVKSRWGREEWSIGDNYAGVIAASNNYIYAVNLPEVAYYEEDANDDGNFNELSTEEPVELVSLRKDTGAKSWEFEIEDQVLTTAKDIAVGDSNIFFLLDNLHGEQSIKTGAIYTDWIYALDKSTGELQWKEKVTNDTAPGNDTYNQIAVHNGDVYVTIDDGDGSAIREYPSNISVYSSTTRNVSSNVTIDDAGNLYWVDKSESINNAGPNGVDAVLRSYSDSNTQQWTHSFSDINKTHFKHVVHKNWVVVGGVADVHGDNYGMNITYINRTDGTFDFDDPLMPPGGKSCVDSDAYDSPIHIYELISAEDSVIAHAETFDAGFCVGVYVMETNSSDIIQRYGRFNEPTIHGETATRFNEFTQNWENEGLDNNDLVLSGDKIITVSDSNFVDSRDLHDTYKRWFRFSVYTDAPNTVYFNKNNPIANVVGSGGYYQDSTNAPDHNFILGHTKGTGNAKDVSGEVALWSDSDARFTIHRLDKNVGEGSKRYIDLSVYNFLKGFEDVSEQISFGVKKVPKNVTFGVVHKDGDPDKIVLPVKEGNTTTPLYNSGTDSKSFQYTDQMEESGVSWGEPKYNSYSIRAYPGRQGSIEYCRDEHNIAQSTYELPVSGNENFFNCIALKRYPGLFSIQNALADFNVSGTDLNVTINNTQNLDQNIPFGPGNADVGTRVVVDERINISNSSVSQEYIRTKSFVFRGNYTNATGIEIVNETFTNTTSGEANVESDGNYTFAKDVNLLESGSTIASKNVSQNITASDIENATSIDVSAVDGTFSDEIVAIPDSVTNPNATDALPIYQSDEFRRMTALNISTEYNTTYTPQNSHSENFYNTSYLLNYTQFSGAINTTSATFPRILNGFSEALAVHSNPPSSTWYHSVLSTLVQDGTNTNITDHRIFANTSGSMRLPDAVTGDIKQQSTQSGYVDTQEINLSEYRFIQAEKYDQVRWASLNGESRDVGNTKTAVYQRIPEEVTIIGTNTNETIDTDFETVVRPTQSRVIPPVDRSNLILHGYSFFDSWNDPTKYANGTVKIHRTLLNQNDGEYYNLTTFINTSIPEENITGIRGRVDKARIDEMVINGITDINSAQSFGSLNETQNKQINVSYIDPQKLTDAVNMTRINDTVDNTVGITRSDIQNITELSGLSGTTESRMQKVYFGALSERIELGTDDIVASHDGSSDTQLLVNNGGTSEPQLAQDDGTIFRKVFFAMPELTDTNRWDVHATFINDEPGGMMLNSGNRYPDNLYRLSSNVNIADYSDIQGSIPQEVDTIQAFDTLSGFDSADTYADPTPVGLNADHKEFLNEQDNVHIMRTHENVTLLALNLMIENAYIENGQEMNSSVFSNFTTTETVAYRRQPDSVKRFGDPPTNEKVLDPKDDISILQDVPGSLFNRSKFSNIDTTATKLETATKIISGIPENTTYDRSTTQTVNLTVDDPPSKVDGQNVSVVDAVFQNKPPANDTDVVVTYNVPTDSGTQEINKIVDVPERITRWEDAYNSTPDPSDWIVKNASVQSITEHDAVIVGNATYPSLSSSVVRPKNIKTLNETLVKWSNTSEVVSTWRACDFELQRPRGQGERNKIEVNGTNVTLTPNFVNIADQSYPYPADGTADTNLQGVKIKKDSLKIEGCADVPSSFGFDQIIQLPAVKGNTTFTAIQETLYEDVEMRIDTLGLVDEFLGNRENKRALSGFGVKPSIGDVNVLVTELNRGAADNFGETVSEYTLDKDDGEVDVIIKDLDPFRSYEIFEDGSLWKTIDTGSNGRLTVTKTGDWSKHSYTIITSEDLEQDVTSGGGTVGGGGATGGGGAGSLTRFITNIRPPNYILLIVGIIFLIIGAIYWWSRRGGGGGNISYTNTSDIKWE